MTALGPWPHGRPMPLTPQERERLAEVEAGLRVDPHLRLDPMPHHDSRRRMQRTVAAALVLVGIALSVAGAAMAPHAFVVGFVIVLTGFLTVVAAAVVWFTAGEASRS